MRIIDSTLKSFTITSRSISRLHTICEAHVADVQSSSEMSNDKTGAYGTSGGGDTAFRKTWDTAEYAQKAAAREAQIREEGKARYEAAVAGKKYIAPPSNRGQRAGTPPDAKDTEARQARLNVSSQIGKTTLVPAGAGVGKRGRGAGFYCEDCDLTYKDNLQYVEHLNSKQHLVATGQSGEVKRATLAEVQERLAWLTRKRDEDKARQTADLSTRLDTAREEDEAVRAEKRRKRNEKRRKTKDGLGVTSEEPLDNGIIC